MPIEQHLLDSSKIQAEAELKKIIVAVRNVTFPDGVSISIDSKDLSNDYISNKLKSVPAGHASELKDTDFIYVVKLLSANKKLNAKIIDKFSHARDDQSDDEFAGKKDYCRLNKENINSHYLYIGRSQKLKGRFKQHLSEGNIGVYAMHMQRWATALKCKVEFTYFRFDNVDNLIVQALEDSLWNYFTPLLGRKGER